MDFTSRWLLCGCIAVVSYSAGGRTEDAIPVETVAIYADSNLGADDNDGRSPEKALRTLNTAQTALEAEVSAGREVTLYLARGSVWREFREAEGADGMSFGIRGLNVVAYGEGDLPTLSGFMILPNNDFKQPDPQKFPNLWSQKIMPPKSYAKSPPDGMRPGLLVGGNRPLRLIHPPGSRFATLRDFHGGIDGLSSEEDVLAFIAKNPNTYFPKENSDGSVEVFLNSGSDPTHDGLSYEFRVFPAGWIIHGASIDGLRITGMGGRHGLDGYPVELKNMEVSFGNTHTVFTTEGILENVRAIPYTVKGAPTLRGKHPRREGLQNLIATALGETYSLFHSFNPDSNGLIYKNCSGADAAMGFFCHNKKARRPFIAIFDSKTENVATLIRHRPFTETMYLIGHRHQSTNGGGFGAFGDGASKNFVEDSVLKFALGPWNPDASHLRVRNSLLVTNSTPGLAINRGSIPPEGIDWEITGSTLVVDLRESKSNPTALIDLPAGSGKSAEAPRRLLLKDCVIVVLGGKAEIPLLSKASDGLDLVVENCLFAGVTNIPEGNSRIGLPDEIFTDLSSIGDFPLVPSINAVGRQPKSTGEFRAIAAALEAPLREKLEARRKKFQSGDPKAVKR